MRTSEAAGRHGGGSDAAAAAPANPPATARRCELVEGELTTGGRIIAGGKDLLAPVQGTVLGGGEVLPGAVLAKSSVLLGGTSGVCIILGRLYDLLGGDGVCAAASILGRVVPEDKEPDDAPPPPPLPCPRPLEIRALTLGVCVSRAFKDEGVVLFFFNPPRAN